MPPVRSQPDADVDGRQTYCRAARRLRGRFTDRPCRLHRELRALAGRHDAWKQAAAVPLTPYKAFAVEVERRLDGPVLRHAERRRLLGIARAMGIGRFEANLAIAAVQHERRDAPRVVPSSGAPARRDYFGLLFLVIALETLIGWGAWFVLHA